MRTGLFRAGAYVGASGGDIFETKARASALFV